MPELSRVLRYPLAALTFIVMVALSGASNATTRDYDRFLNLYDGLLQQHVAASSTDQLAYNAVDYDGWAGNSNHGLARRHFFKTDPEQFSTRDEQLAFWINAYNFLTIDLIVRENERETIKNLGSLFKTPWQKHTWPIAGQDLSLDDIEHEIIRPLGEARIHFAVNCAALSCPDLRAEAYRADQLDQQLDDQVRATFQNDAKGLRYDEAKMTLYVSKVMDWFGEDFQGGDLHAWLRDYKPDIIKADTKIRFLPYDWGLNKPDA